MSVHKAGDKLGDIELDYLAGYKPGVWRGHIDFAFEGKIEERQRIVREVGAFFKTETFHVTSAAADAALLVDVTYKSKDGRQRPQMATGGGVLLSIFKDFGVGVRLDTLESGDQFEIEIRFLKDCHGVLTFRGLCIPPTETT